MAQQPTGECVISSTATYYEILGVGKDATTQQITKSYYRLARTYHPDKNPNDPTCEEKFKLISEAYQVLTDAEKRKKYDTYGKESLDANFVHPKEIFSMLFGGGKFDDFFGEVSLVDAIFSNQDEAGNSTDPSLADLDPMELEIIKQQEREEEMRKRKEERMRQLIHKLIVRIEPFVLVRRVDSMGAFASFSPFSPSTNLDDNPTEGEEVHAEILRLVANELIEAPGGFELLDLISYIYIQESEKNTGAFLGVPGFFTKVAEKGHLIKEGVGLARLALKLYQTSKKLQEQTQQLDGAAPVTESEQEQRARLEGELTEKLLQQGLQTMWRMGKFDIELAVRAACDAVINEVPQLRKARARALGAVGAIFKAEIDKARRVLAVEGTKSPFEQLPFGFSNAKA